MRWVRSCLLALALLSVPLTGCREPDLPLAVLYSRETPYIRPVLSSGEYREFTLEGFRNPGVRAATVIVAGHSVPPTYAGQTPEALATAIASFRPSLVVLDTCYGASTPILDSLAARLDSWVVAAPYLIPIQGMRYQEDLFTEPDPARRATMMETDPPFPLLRWRLDAGKLADARQAVDRMTPAELRQHLKLAVPALVRVDLPTELEAKAQLLVPVPPERFRP